MKPLITNIQRFSLHDGPGIRTTVFFKGCSLHCPWCANPENISCKEEVYYISEKCNTQCGHMADCRKKIYSAECIYNAIGKWGEYYTEEKLYDILIKDKTFYGEEGGVTFSGGEPLLFLPKYYSNLCAALHEDGINLCAETALFVSKEAAKWLAEVMDYIYIDIKILNPNKCKSYLGGDLQQYLKNLSIVHENKGNKKIIYRIPLIQGYTDSEENFDNIYGLLKEFPPYKVEILKAHNLGKKKYERLGKEYVEVSSPDAEKIRLYVEKLSVDGIAVEVKQV